MRTSNGRRALWTVCPDPECWPLRGLSEFDHRADRRAAGLWAAGLTAVLPRGPARRAGAGDASAAAARSPGPAGRAGGADRPGMSPVRGRRGRAHPEPAGDRPQQDGRPRCSARCAWRRPGAPNLYLVDAGLPLPVRRRSLARLAAVEAARGSCPLARGSPAPPWTAPRPGPLLDDGFGARCHPGCVAQSYQAYA